MSTPRHGGRARRRPRKNLRQQNGGHRPTALVIGMSVVMLAGAGVAYFTTQTGESGDGAVALDEMSANDMARLSEFEQGGGGIMDLEAQEVQAVATAKKRAYRKGLAAARKKGIKFRSLGEKLERKSSGTTGDTPSGSANPSGNRAIGKAMLEARGMAGQWGCLEQLWQKESGWNHRARNPSSGAYGIPQALPAGKMASAGSDWQTNPRTQIKWGLGYIKGRYGTPCGAWSHSQRTGWY